MGGTLAAMNIVSAAQASPEPEDRANWIADECAGIANANVPAPVAVQRTFEKCMTEGVNNDYNVSRVEGRLQQDKDGRIVRTQNLVVKTDPLKGSTQSRFLSVGTFGQEGSGGYTNYKITRDGKGLDD